MSEHFELYDVVLLRGTRLSCQGGVVLVTNIEYFPAVAFADWCYYLAVFTQVADAFIYFRVALAPNALACPAMFTSFSFGFPILTVGGSDAGFSDVCIFRQ